MNTQSSGASEGETVITENQAVSIAFIYLTSQTNKYETAHTNKYEILCSQILMENQAVRITLEHRFVFGLTQICEDCGQRLFLTCAYICQN